ncbi:unnamed protein product, partial [Iphiclides podalirius]
MGVEIVVWGREHTCRQFLSKRAGGRRGRGVTGAAAAAPQSVTRRRSRWRYIPVARSSQPALHCDRASVYYIIGLYCDTADHAISPRFMFSSGSGGDTS